MTKIYIASFFDTRERLFPMRDALESAGIGVTSRWLTEQQEELSTKVSETLKEAVTKYKGLTHSVLHYYAVRDWEDIQAATWLVCDTFDITPRGGREVEVGLALAWEKPVFIVGPERNVFHKLATAQYDSWEAAIPALIERSKLG